MVMGKIRSVGAKILIPNNLVVASTVLGWVPYCTGDGVSTLPPSHHHHNRSLKFDFCRQPPLSVRSNMTLFDHDQQQQQHELSVTLSLIGLTGFFLALLCVALSNFQPLFLAAHGRSHRLAGAALLFWLCVGVLQTLKQYYRQQDYRPTWLYYDTVLGVLGITTTLTAARDFPHKLVQNAKGQSGSLSNKALVTQAEMIEHSFYQGLNLLQAWYLHFLTTTVQKSNNRVVVAFLALVGVTSPWCIRHHFPVHSFSHNWKVTPSHQRTPQETILYRIKKAQYLFYKHVLLHGVNITVALFQSTIPSSTPLPCTLPWRVYWLALNTSYVMEFFLQTLVRRNLLATVHMFRLQRWLMATSSVAAVWVLIQLLWMESELLWWRPPLTCLTSLVLNFTNRHQDVTNVLLTAALFYYWAG